LLPATGIAASSLTAAASSLTGQLEEKQSKRTVVQSPNLTCSKLAVKTFCLFCIDLRPSDNENNKNKNKNERHHLSGIFTVFSYHVVVTPNPPNPPVSEGK